MAATGKLAEELGAAPGRVTRMLKTFRAPELVIFTRYEDVRLTEVAKFLALHLSRRHRLIGVFGQDILFGVGESSRGSGTHGVCGKRLNSLNSLM